MKLTGQSMSKNPDIAVCKVCGSEVTILQCGLKDVYLTDAEKGNYVCDWCLMDVFEGKDG